MKKENPNGYLQIDANRQMIYYAFNKMCVPGTLQKFLPSGSFTT